MSIVAAHPALAIWGAIIILACLTVYALLRLTDERGQHAQGRRFEAELDAAWQKAPPAPALHHDWYAAPTITLAPAAPDATPDSGPAAGARAPEPPAADSNVCPHCARDLDAEQHQIGCPGLDEPPNVPPGDTEAPGPDGAPEGDEPAARPPQGTARPGDLLENAPGAPMVAGEIPARPLLVSAHETAAPGDLLAKAVAAVREQPVSDYLSEVQDATAWETRAPLAALLSDDTMTRAGFPPIKEEVAR